jgi:hypothetical protein
VKFIFKLPGADQMAVELIQAGDNALHSEIRKLINPTWNKEELQEQFKKFLLYLAYGGAGLAQAV